MIYLFAPLKFFKFISTERILIQFAVSGYLCFLPPTLPLFMGIVTNVFTTSRHSIGMKDRLYLFPLINSSLLSTIFFNSVSLNGMLKPIVFFKKPTFRLQFLIF